MINEFKDIYAINFLSEHNAAFKIKYGIAYANRRYNYGLSYSGINTLQVSSMRCGSLESFEKLNSCLWK